MKQVNLLPIQIRTRAERQRLIPIGLFAGVVSVGLAFAILLTLNYDLSVINAGLDKAHQQQEAEKTTSTTASEEKEAADQVTRIAQFNALSKAELNWPRAFSFVSTVVPKDVRLLSYSYATSANTLSLRMTGSAPSNLSFAVFVESLRGNSKIKDTKVDSYTFAPTTGTVTFSVTIQVPFSQVDYSAAN